MIMKGSNHYCIILDPTPPSKFVPRPFRFEWVWITHHKCKDHIEFVWSSIDSPDGFNRVKMGLEVLPSSLRTWNKRVFGNIDSNIDKARANIKEGTT